MTRKMCDLALPINQVHKLIWRWSCLKILKNSKNFKKLPLRLQFYLSKFFSNNSSGTYNYLLACRSHVQGSVAPIMWTVGWFQFKQVQNLPQHKTQATHTKTIMSKHTVKLDIAIDALFQMRTCHTLNKKEERSGVVVVILLRILK